MDNAYPTCTKNVPSVAPSKERVPGRMGRFAPMVGSRRRRRKAMGFIFFIIFLSIFVFVVVFFCYVFKPEII